MNVVLEGFPMKARRSHGAEMAFVIIVFVVFYAIVYGIEVSDGVISTGRSVLLIAYAFSLMHLQDRFAIFNDTLPEEKQGVRSIALWGASCFAFNFIVVGGSFVLFLRGFANAANTGFAALGIGSKPLIVRILMALAAALSEEVVYRRVLFRYLLSLRLPDPAKLVLAFSVSSLVFGFGHFHAGVEKCVTTSISGLVFAGFYLRRKNIWVVIVGHFLGDGLAFIV